MQNNIEEIVNCCICNVSSALCPDFVHVNEGTLGKEKPIILVISHLMTGLGSCESTVTLRSQHICNYCIQDLAEYDEAVKKLESIQKRFKHLLLTTTVPVQQQQTAQIEQFMPVQNDDEQQTENDLSDWIEVTDIPDNIIEETDEFFGDHEEIDVTGLTMEFDAESHHQSWLRLSPFNEEVVTVESNTNDASNFKIRCPKCNKVFFNKIRYKDHVDFEHANPNDPDSLLCRICHRIFRNLEYLELHMNIHEGKTEKQCRYCDKSYTKKENVLRHMQRHWHKTLECDVCGEAFSNNTSYSNHKALHDIDGPVECGTCLQVFKNRRTLKSHMLTHNKMRTRYLCKHPNCPKSFTEKYRLKLHCRNQHGVIEQ